MLEQTLDDSRVSRAEAQALGDVLKSVADDPGRLHQVRATAFDLVCSRLRETADRQLLDWLEDVVKRIDHARPDPESPVVGQVYFSPGTTCVRRLLGLLSGAETSIDLCVFTITDDRLSQAILKAHQRGVAVRIISDNLKAADPGSDILALERAEIPILLDRSPSHMHHKFGLFDSRWVATGSYNWTRSAARENQENLIVTDHANVVARFGEEFERLWNRFSE